MTGARETRRAERKARLAGWASLILFLIMAVCWILAAWTTERWFWTGDVFLIAGLICAIIYLDEKEDL